MPSKTEIVNLALGHLAVAKTIGNLETEKSVEALVGDRKSTRLNSSHIQKSRMPSSA